MIAGATSDEPGAERALLLALVRGYAGTEDDSAAGQLIPAVDQASLTERLRRLKVLGLFGARLLELAPEVIEEGLRSAVEDTLALGRRHALLMQSLTWRIASELETEGIRAMPLKGPFLAERLHGSGRLRLSHDIDLLVHRRDLTRAGSLLEGLGYRRHPGNGREPVLHLSYGHPSAPPIDLHWRIDWYEDLYADGLLDRSRLQDNLRIPAAEDELLSLLVFHSRDGLEGLRFPADVAAWWKLLGSEETIAACSRLAERHAPLRRPLEAAAIAIEQVTLLPVRSAVCPSDARRRVALAVAMMDWAGDHDERTRDVTAKVVDGMLCELPALPGWAMRALVPALPGTGARRLLAQLMHALALLGRGTVLLLRAGATARRAGNRVARGL
jgi:hypothetical protein